MMTRWDALLLGKVSFPISKKNGMYHIQCAPVRATLNPRAYSDIEYPAGLFGSMVSDWYTEQVLLSRCFDVDTYKRRIVFHRPVPATIAGVTELVADLQAVRHIALTQSVKINRVEKYFS